MDEAQAVANVLKLGLKDAGDGSDKDLTIPVGIAIKDFLAGAGKTSGA